MHKVALFGAGKIGDAITNLLVSSKRYELTVFDSSEPALQALKSKWPSIKTSRSDLSSTKGIGDSLKGFDAVLSALPFFCNVPVAEAAVKCGAHYLDLTEDVETTKKIKNLAKNSKTALMPQCGLAPGFISIAALSVMKNLDSVQELKLRVGALPVYPTNRLMYNMTWSTDGLINEYCNPCEAIVNGEKVLLQPLEGYEKLSLDGAEYEAFNTSGGLGTLWESVSGKVNNLNYKTIRYPGHRDLVQFLLFELGFKDDREPLKKALDRNIPGTKQDKCIIFAEAVGTESGRLTKSSYASVVYGSEVNGSHLNAIQLTTAAGICVPLDLVLNKKLGKSGGFVRMEEISLAEFVKHEFGKYYKA
jgi:saccharopine dehydrogenase-like NADP-dependent oxidoreductase